MKGGFVSQWVKQWDVPGSNGNTWRVSLKNDGTYACSCPVWKFRRKQCKHIQGVIDGEYDIKPVNLPKHALAMVKEVTKDKDGTVLIPLIPLDDPHFCITVIFDLLRIGFPWNSDLVKNYRKYFNKLSKDTVEEFIQRNGRKVYDEWIEGTGPAGFEIVPLKKGVKYG